MRKLFRLSWLLLSMASLHFAGAAYGAQVFSDGSDGAYDPSVNGDCTVTTCRLTLDADGVFNFTTVNIPAGYTVYFIRNVANSPAVIAATGDITIAGTLEASAYITDLTNPQFAIPEAPKRGGGPGGFDGGLRGTPGSPLGLPGDGPAGGANGDPAGGGGHATPGGVGTRYGGSPGAGGAQIGPADPLRGGSGGGGGNIGYSFGVPLDAGHGGGGGGAVQLSTPTAIDISGRIGANGANGGWSFANVFASGGEGGGGAGGMIELYGGSIDLTGSLEAIGGYGGGLGTQPYTNDPAAFTSFADGGLGYVRIETNVFNNAGTIDAQVVPLPAAAGLLGLPLLVLATNRRKRNS